MVKYPQLAFGKYSHCFPNLNIKPLLYKTINTSRTSQNGPNIAKKIQNVIDDLGGPDRVVGFVTDNASNIQSAWEILESDNQVLL